MIVVISHPDDEHAAGVLRLLHADGHDAALLDLSELPGRATVTVDYRGDGPRAVYRRDGREALELTRARAVWWRRPQSPDLARVTDGEVHTFTQNEWHEALNGVWQVLDVPWMNPPALDEVASRKANQLRVAAQLGLAIPETVITSDPDVARAFVGAQGRARTIFKTFSCTHAIWRETRLVGDEELALLDQVRLAPVIFQRYVPGDADIRVTVVGPRLFAAAIHARDTDYPVDFRMSLGQARTEPCELPPAVAGRLRALMARLGLVYGAIDLRRTPEGEHVFLEVNTAGEFLFVEDRTGQPISRAVADWLVTPA